MTEENRYNNLLASTHKKNKKGYDNNEFDDDSKFFFQPPFVRWSNFDHKSQSFKSLFSYLLLVYFNYFLYRYGSTYTLDTVIC